MKVGVFDSGLGGLTVVDAITQTFKGADIFYIADTLAAPYGEKSQQQILEHSFDVAQYLIDTHDIDALVVACNTATSASIHAMREKFPSLILIGTEPGIKPALESTKSGKIGVLATEATLKGEKYQLLVDKLSDTKSVMLYEQACPGLVEQIEQGKIEDQETYHMLQTWLNPMIEKGVDTIVLGCTHYPLVEMNIKKIMGDNVTLIETGFAIANRLKALSHEAGHKNDGELKVYVYFTGTINTDMVNSILKNWEHGGKIMVRGMR